MDIQSLMYLFCVQIACEFLKLILPDLQQQISSQIPDLQCIVDGAIKYVLKSVSFIVKKVIKLQRDVDDGEQYCHLNRVRISGVGESGEEDTDRIIKNIARDLDADITLNDTVKSHRVGKSRNGRPPAIVVKFTSYRARHAFYSKRMDLRHLNAGRNVFINEDLTARRNKLLFNARKYVKSEQLKTAYSSDGRVYVKDNNDVRHFISDQGDLPAFGIL